MLAEHFLALFAREIGEHDASLSSETLALLQAYDFPGNVRELKNIIEHALIISGGTIGPQHLFLAPTTPPKASPSSIPAAPPADPDLPFNLQQAEIVLIQRALEHTKGNLSKAAKLLGISRKKVYAVLERQEATPGHS